MGKTWIIARRDFRNYFSSPIAYVVAGVFLGIMGWMFFFNLKYYLQQNMQYQSFNYGKGVGITDGIIRPVFGNMNVIFLFLVPFVTMRLFAEERKQHTLELMMTAPVKLHEMIFGKFLSSFLLVALMLLLTLVYPLTLALGSSPDWGPIFLSYFGTLLMFGCYLAVGVFCSSLTENQIVAAVLTWGILLFFWLVSWASQFSGPFWNDVFNELSLIHHYNNFGRGILTSNDTLFFLSFGGVFLILTHRMLDSYRWR